MSLDNPHDADSCTCESCAPPYDVCPSLGEHSFDLGDLKCIGCGIPWKQSDAMWEAAKAAYEPIFKDEPMVELCDRIEDLEASLDVARDLIADLSRRPTVEDYHALLDRLAELELEVKYGPFVPKPAHGFPPRALKYSV